ncbi:MAG: sensor histidine kinase [Pelagimonas sp.]|uniref:sensor histidine kinase n=1 Tax=Pelagimonas sp. TaxID=2073170 RepID=UPI003D6BA9F1
MTQSPETTSQKTTAEDVLAEEARLLRERAVGSARSLMTVILLITGVLLVLGLLRTAGLWFFLTSFMVLVTLVYAQVLWKDGIARERVQTYLHGHIVITAITGLLWAAFAISVADQEHEVLTLVAGLFLSSLTTGGVMAGTIYRPGYLALAASSLVPFALFLIVEMHGLLQIFGAFCLLYFGFCVTTNKQASQKSREAIVANLEHQAAEKEIAKHEENQRIQEEKSRFVAAISHDMSQPMMAQRNLIEALEAKVDTADQLELIKQIRKTQSSQEKFLSELARSNQLDEVIHTLRISDVSIPVLFDQLRAEFTPQCHDLNVVLHVTCRGEHVSTDPHYVERILRNLLSNALKYGRVGGHVWIAATQDQDTVSLSVRDNGPGIDQSAQDQVFTEFVRLPRDEALPGTGLGLSICRRLADQLGGQLSIKSELGQGTELTLHLPKSDPHHQVQPLADRKFVLCVGQKTSETLGDWEALFSSWFWEFAHGETFSDAKILLEALRLEPDVILLDRPDLDVSDSAEIACLAEKAPMILVGQGTDMDGRLAELAIPIETPKNQTGFQKSLQSVLSD